MRAVLQSPAFRAGSDGKMYSQAEISWAPGLPPTARTVVSASFATACALLCRIVEEDDRARRSIDLLAVDGEGRVTVDDEVELFVAARFLGVVLDHLVARAAAPCTR